MSISQGQMLIYNCIFLLVSKVVYTRIDKRAEKENVYNLSFYNQQLVLLSLALIYTIRPHYHV